MKYTLESIIQKFAEDAHKYAFEMENEEQDYFNLPKALAIMANEIKKLKDIDEEMKKFTQGFAYRPPEPKEEIELSNDPNDDYHLDRSP